MTHCSFSQLFAFVLKDLNYDQVIFNQPYEDMCVLNLKLLEDFIN